MAWSAYRAKAEDGARQHMFATWSVRKKLLLALIPSIVLILMVTGFVTNWFSSRYLNLSLQRGAQSQNLAQALELEEILEFARRSLLELAQQRPDRERMEAALRQWSVYHPDLVREVAFIGLNTADALLLVVSKDVATEIKPDQFNFVRNSPISQVTRGHNVKRGHVLLSELTEVVYPPSAFPDTLRAKTIVVYRLVTPFYDAQASLRGYLVVSIDARAVRNVLSLYNSSKSPLYAFARSSENRFSFFFDDQGWMLFQSENLEDPDKDLSIESARLGLTGDYGMPAYDKAFRPSPKHEFYWRMVVETQAGRTGVEDGEPLSEAGGALSSQHFIVYAPVRFLSNPDKEPEVIGGLAFVDRSLLVDAAEFRHLDVMAVITVVAIGLIVLLLFFISKVITRPVLMLAAEIRAMFEEKALRPVRLETYDLESGVLTRALNLMIRSIQDKQEQIRQRDEHIQMVAQRQKVSFDSEIPTSLGWRLVGEIPDLIGQSSLMANLQSLIRKAASADADVLVVGETGTGKELTAEGIHKFSNRSTKPFISINCGGLDESLLMDTLFGHVKGAFTEAKTDRKGAFLASDGGTLFLDEIGTASPKVQVALLRALSVRRIRPLGSDQEVEFNVRVVAATNVDLMELVQRGEFRDDLYYRLKVITIQTPPLRQRKEDIPVLASHFLKECAVGSNRREMGLSRGALEKLLEYNWPGNVRELKNCITRAVAFSDGDVLYAEDLVFDDAMILAGGYVERLDGQSFGVQPRSYEPRSPEPAQPGGAPPAAQASSAEALGKGNPRRQTALRLARERGSFTRLDYQDALGAGVSQRTAQYDLHSLVTSGQLRKSGKGPATQYSLASSDG